ncbi:hypothetical protein EAF00_002031 [Botryotinia globosa]|nr:hypothetical protein EAF00_002031 [Botryotinia globosa]
MGFVPPPLITHDRDFHATVSDFLTANQLPKIEGQQKRLKVKVEYTADLPYDNKPCQPASLTQYSGNSHDRAHYRRAVNAYASQLERDILERMRNVTSSMIAEAIYTDESREICRSENARHDLELFFARSATNDQLHYVYSRLWTAVDFGFVMDNSVRPNAQEEQV